MSITVNQVIKSLLKFRKDRDWKQFHSPQNIAKSLVLEANEVLEIFQWKDTSDKLSKQEKEQLAEELADVYNWVLLLSHDLEIDINQMSLKKISENSKKYPVSKSKGTAKKYSQL